MPRPLKRHPSAALGAVARPLCDIVRCSVEPLRVRSRRYRPTSLWCCGCGFAAPLWTCQVAVCAFAGVWTAGGAFLPVFTGAEAPLFFKASRLLSSGMSPVLPVSSGTQLCLACGHPEPARLPSPTPFKTWVRPPPLCPPPQAPSLYLYR